MSGSDQGPVQEPSGETDSPAPEDPPPLPHLEDESSPPPLPSQSARDPDNPPPTPTTFNPEHPNHPQPQHVGKSTLRKKKGCRSSFWSAFLWVAIVILLGGGWLAQLIGFEIIRNMRQLERIPDVEAIALVEGEVTMSGWALDGGEKVDGKYTKTRSYYLYWLEEEWEDDDDGGGSWRTRASGRRHADSFVLKDQTGTVEVSLKSLSKSGVDPDLRLDHRHRRGDRRFSEYRIDPEDKFFAFAKAEPRNSTETEPGTPGYQLNFASGGSSFTPILAENATATSIRSGQGTNGVVSSIISVVAFAFGIMLLCFKLRIHRLLLFLTLLSGLNLCALFLMGLGMLATDLEDGKDRLSRHTRSATAAVEHELNLDEGSFNWEGSLSALQNHEDQQSRRRVLGIREDYAAAIERTNAILTRFPERHLAPLWGVRATPSILEEEDPPLDDFEITKSPIPRWMVWIGGAIALICGILGSVSGFRRVKTKRYIENVPTSLSTGLAYGPAEIKGKSVLYEGDNHFIQGPLTGDRCCHVRYKVTEERGSGKDKETVTIEHWTEQVPFLCHDKEGWTRVVPAGAEMRVDCTAHTRSGRRDYYEYSVSEGEDLYILGSAVIEPIEGEALQIADGDNDGFPFLISDKSENDTMLRVSKGALTKISFGFIGIVTLVMLMFAGTGSYSPTDFMAAALTAPAFLVFSTFILMFNDLVFLRNRVKRAHSNIEVALKKRFDLIPNLESIAQSYLGHERELQEHLAKLRSIHKGRKKYTPDQIDSAIRADRAVTDRMLALFEDHPDLKGNTVTADLMNRLVRVENEIALMRDGYNDSVELYRTGSQRFPEVLLAKAFAFRDADFLRAELEVRKVPEVDMGP